MTAKVYSTRKLKTGTAEVVTEHWHSNMGYRCPQSGTLIPRLTGLESPIINFKSS